MPTNKTIDLLIKEVGTIREKLEAHLEDSGNIRTDISWLRRAFWALFGAVLSFIGLLSIAILNHLWK